MLRRLLINTSNEKTRRLITAREAYGNRRSLRAYPVGESQRARLAVLKSAEVWVTFRFSGLRDSQTRQARGLYFSGSRGLRHGVACQGSHRSLSFSDSALWFAQAKHVFHILLPKKLKEREGENARESCHRSNGFLLPESRLTWFACKTSIVSLRSCQIYQLLWMRLGIKNEPKTDFITGKEPWDMLST